MKSGEIINYFGAGEALMELEKQLKHEMLMKEIGRLVMMAGIFAIVGLLIYIIWLNNKGGGEE